jgi:hypothetical protein
MLRLNFLLLILILSGVYQEARSQQSSKEELIFLTSEWKGDRFPDGRPKVPDHIIKRMKLVSVEEAWIVMKNAGYLYQIAEGWQQINPDSVLVGRAITATFMPGRPDVWKAIETEVKSKVSGGKIHGP